MPPRLLLPIPGLTAGSEPFPKGPQPIPAAAQFQQQASTALFTGFAPEHHGTGDKNKWATVIFPATKGGFLYVSHNIIANFNQSLYSYSNLF